MASPNSNLGYGHPNPSNSANVIPQPADIIPGELVENIYTYKAEVGALIDLNSARIMGRYLVNRIYGKPVGADVKWVRDRVPGRLPRPRIVPNGTKDVKRTVVDGYYISWKQAVAATLIGTVALNGLINARSIVGDIGDEIGQATHGIARFFNPLEPKTTYRTETEVRILPGEELVTKVDVTGKNKPGSSTIDVEKIDAAIRDYQKRQDEGYELKKWKVIGGSSDDYGTEASIGVRESKEQDMADNRAEALAAAIIKSAKRRGITDITDPTIVVEQSVLTPAQKEYVLGLAESEGFSGIIPAIEAVQAGNKQVSKELRNAITELFVNKRYNELEFTMVKPTFTTEVETKRYEVTETPTDQKPADPDRPYRFIPFIIPPIPRLRRVFNGVKQKRRIMWDKVKLPYFVFRPIFQLHDRSWVDVEKEALDKDGTLKANPWAYTNKFNHILREDWYMPDINSSSTEQQIPVENETESAEAVTESEIEENNKLNSRITAVLRADYEKKDGVQDTLRIMFVDHMPKPELVEAYDRLIKVMASMQSGSLGKKISGIFVYPSHNAGLEHGDPRRLGLGVDEQVEVNVLGLCTPILELVEMHAPTGADSDELYKKLLKQYMGSEWVLAHEVIGHGTDAVDKKQKLRPVRARGITNAYLPVGSSWKDGLGAVGRSLKPLLDRRGSLNEPIWFLGTFDYVDANNKRVEIKRRIAHNDPNISLARDLQILESQPTQYAGVNSMELWAESVAQVATSILVPLNEAGAKRQDVLTVDGEVAAFADGYSIDPRSSRELRRRLGADITGEANAPLTFENPARVTVALTTAEADPLIGKMIAEARKKRIKTPDEMLSILAELRS